MSKTKISEEIGRLVEKMNVQIKNISNKCYFMSKNNEDNRPQLGELYTLISIKSELETILENHKGG